MHIYFARSLRGQHSPLDKVVNDEILAAIKKAACKSQFEIPVDPDLKKDIERGDRYIYLRDISWIDRSDAMIAEVTNVSHGVGYEIAYAKHVRRIPILCVNRRDEPVSAMITGDLEVLKYDGAESLTAHIQKFLNTVHVSIR